MKHLENILKSSFTIIGTIIGAGFISGREILTFFRGTDILKSVLLLFIILTLALWFLLSLKEAPKCLFTKLFRPLILAGNLIILSGMLSAVDELASAVFPWSARVPLFSVGALIFSAVVMRFGIDGLKAVNAVLVPTIIAFVLITLIKNNDVVLFGTGVALNKLTAYVGVNVFMSSPVFIGLGKDLSRGEGLISSALSSLILCGVIFLIYTSLCGQGNEVVESSVPLLKYFQKSRVLFAIFTIIMFFGIMTTLLSSHYPLYEFSASLKHSELSNSVVLISAFSISRLGFYGIVNYVYPILGGLGAVYIVGLFIIRIFKKFSLKRVSIDTLKESNYNRL